MSDERRSVREILASMDASLKARDKADEVFRVDLAKRLDNHGGRLKSLETWRSLLTGAIGVVLVVGKAIYTKVEGMISLGGR